LTGRIFDIKHFAVHDGPGIRTTVFLKGCPLKCLWCHNPESIGRESQLGFLEHKCTLCGRCVAVCASGGHFFDENGKHIFDRSKCTRCGKCEKACVGGALTFYGRQAELEEIVADVLKDKDFYTCSKNGGVTLSGGECLMQADFCAELLKRLKEEGIHTAVDTCGFVAREAIDKVIPYTDLFLYDLKAIDSEVHKKCTGRDNAVILENLKYIDSKGKAVEIRYPYVPGLNDGEAGKIAEFVKTLSPSIRVKVLPYHNYAETKYKSLGMDSTLPSSIPSDDEINAAKELLRSFGIRVAD
jgi:pyruvate formate lyase activating enzyme